MTTAVDPRRMQPALRARPTRFAGVVWQRMHEPTFWLVQFGVLAVMGLHGAVEGLGFLHGGIGSALVDISVVLYLVPVAYAGLRYGFEGGALTATWATTLAVPNLVFWHQEHFEWVGEMMVLGLVITMGVVVAIPVERERRQRGRTEAANQRLRLLNRVTSLLIRTDDQHSQLHEIAEQVTEGVGLEHAAIVRDAGGGRVSVETRAGSASPWSDGVLARLGDVRDDRPIDDGTWAFPIHIGDERWGWLVAQEPTGRAGDLGVLGAVAVQLGVAIDNARLHRQEEEWLRTHLADVARAQEEERARIARDLHDIATHELLLVCREVDDLVDAPGDQEVMTARLRELRDRTTSVVDYLRRFIRDLRPSILDALGLLPAIVWLAEEAEARTGLDVEVIGTGSGRRLEAETEIALFRIVQETLRNVDRHAGAHHVRIMVHIDRVGYRVDVDDDGAGFTELPAPELARGGKLGILGMRERAQMAGSTLGITASPLGGTRVTVSSNGSLD